jgi:lipopolysaccharide transport system permease protein
MFFANSLNHASNSLVSNANLITKVYFPRLAAPIATVLSGVVDLAFASLVFLGMLPYYGLVPTSNLIWLPFFLLLAIVSSLGVGLWLSALNVQFRDVRYAVPFLAQLWMFATPIAYPSSLLSERWALLYALNPMVGVVEGFRWALLDTDTALGLSVAASSSVALALLIGGALYFRKMEKTFADTV